MLMGASELSSEGSEEKVGWRLSQMAQWKMGDGMEGMWGRVGVRTGGLSEGR